MVVSCDVVVIDHAVSIRLGQSMFARLIDGYLGRQQPADVRLWHKWVAPFPVRLVDGSRAASAGQLWRRKRLGRWEYRQDPETMEEWGASQW
jgi:hypothetical protein